MAEDAMANASRSSHDHSEQDSDLSTVFSEMDDEESPSHGPVPHRGQYVFGDHVQMATRRDWWRSPRDVLISPGPTATDLQRIAVHRHVEALAGLAGRMGLRSPAESVGSSPDSAPADPSGTGDDERTVRDLLLSEDENLLSRVIEQLEQRRDLLRCVDASSEAPDLPPTPDQSSPASSSEASDVSNRGDARTAHNTGTMLRNPSPSASSVAGTPGNAVSSSTSQPPAAASLHPASLDPRRAGGVYRQGVRVPWRQDKVVVVRLPDPSNHTLASNQATNSTETQPTHSSSQPWVFIPSGHQQTPMPPDSLETTGASPENFGRAWGQKDWDFTFPALTRAAPEAFGGACGQKTRDFNFTFRA